MKPYQSPGVAPAGPSPSRAHPVGLPRANCGLALLLLALCLAMVFLSPAWAVDGALDPTFITGPGPYAGVQTIPEIRGQSGYPYGSTGGVNWPFNNYQLLFGTFWGLNVNGVTSPNNNNSCIARLTNTGALDTNFLTNSQINGEIRGAYIYPHNDPYCPDKILIWGNFNVSPAGGGNSSYVNFARLNANGDVDNTLPSIIQWGGAVNAVAVQGSGTTAKILVGGYNLRTSQTGDVPCYQLLRLNHDGNLDSNYTHWGAPGGYITSIKAFSGDPLFGNDVRIFCSYPKNQDGSGGTYYMLLLDSNAALPSITAPVASIGNELVDGPIFNMARQSNGQWLICGQFEKVYNTATLSWVARNRVARFLGMDNFSALDINYDVTGGVSTGGPNGVVTQINPMNSSGNPSYDDRMVLAGNFSTWNGAPVGCLVRLKTDGTVDTFNSGTGATGADDRIMRLGWNSNGSGGMICGYFRSYNGQARGGIAGLNADGSLNTTNFSNITANAGWSGMVYSLATQSDGKIIIGGDFNGVDGKNRSGLARLNPNGSLDTSFIGGVDGIVRSVAIEADGKILVAGQFGMCSSYARTSLARLNPANGSVDTAFNPLLVNGDNSVNTLYQVLPLSNGQMMIAGEMWKDDIGNFPAARLNSDGTPDTGFNASNFYIPEAQYGWGTRVAAVGNNYLIAGLYYTSNNSNYWNNNGFLARLTSSGAVDTSFGPTAPVANIQTMDGEVDDLLLQPDGKIVVSGGFSHISDGSGSPPTRSFIARFSADGLLDNTFTPNIPLPTGANAGLLPAMARQPNGKILIEGSAFYNTSSNSTYLGTMVARLNPNGSMDSSFSEGNPTNGNFYYGAGSSILLLPKGKALIGGSYSDYRIGTVDTAAWSLTRIFAGPANYNPAILDLLLSNEPQ